MTGKSGKRFLAAVLTVCMVLSLAVGASAANTNRFTDVKTSHWAYDEIIDVVDKEIFMGTSATTFAPEMEMNRAMFVTVLARLAGVEVDDREASGFRDVPTGKWYTGAVAWAAEEGIVKGVSATMFAPDQVITREQMATMILRYTDYLKIKLPTPEKEIRFDDDREISGFAEDAVLACQRAGLLQGVGNNRFNPQGTATRSQVAVLVSRLAEIDGTIAYTVSFEPNNDKTVEDQTVMSGKTAKQPTGVTRSGYRLSGWYTDEKLTQRFTFTTKITGNLTLYAKWTRNSGGGSYVTYYDPTGATEAEVGGAVTTTGSPFYGMPLTYPTVTMNGSQIKLSGVYKAADVKAWFGDAYKDKPGYVVPLKLTAPSNYSSGDVTLKVTGETGIAEVNKTIKRDELDGDYYFYLLKFVPKDTTGWNPTITVNWNGTSVSYTMDVTGMTKAVDSPENDARMDTMNSTEAATINPEDAKNLTLPSAMVAKTGTENQYKVYLSGGYTLTDTGAGYYTIPLRFYAPSEAFTGSAAVSITGAALNSNQNYNTLNSVTYIDYLLKVPVPLSSGWNPVITVTWTSTQPESRWVWRTAENVTYTYTIDVSGMGQTKTSKLPTAGTEAQINTATNLESNKAFKGIAPYCADVTLTETSAGSKTFTASGTYAPLPVGTDVPGFGVVGNDKTLKPDSLIIPIMFYRPSGLNIDAMADTDNLLNIKFYRDGAETAASDKSYTLKDIKNENPFLFLLQVDAASLTNSGYSRTFELTWFGGYKETYTIKLGKLERIGGATAAGIPGADALKTSTDGTAFAGIAPYVADVAAVRKDNQTNQFNLTGSYVPVPKDAKVPGFGTSGNAGDKLDGDWCILPFRFDFTPPAVNTLADDYKLATVTITKENDTAVKTVDLMKSQVMADPSFTFLFLLKDPQKAGTDGKSLTFQFAWADGKTETFTYDIANLTRSTVNADGAKFQIDDTDKTGITGEGPFKDIVINAVDILATANDDGSTTLKLSQLDPVQKADRIIPYYGTGYGDGYIVALKFAAPTDGAKYTALTQTVTGGYTGKDAPQVKEITLDEENGAHILLMYIPYTKPYEDYAPVIELKWEGTKTANERRWSFLRDAEPDTVTTKQVFNLDLSGMEIKTPGK